MLLFVAKASSLTSILIHTPSKVLRRHLMVLYLIMIMFSTDSGLPEVVAVKVFRTSQVRDRRYMVALSEVTDSNQ